MSDLPPSNLRPGPGSVGAYADGAPVGGFGVPGGGWGDPTADMPGVHDIPIPPAPAAAAGSVVERVTTIASRIRQFEGPRGYSLRATVIVKHVAWLVTILLCCAATHWAFAANPAWRFGGLVLLYSVTFMLVVSAVGCVLYADSRVQIYNQMKHFVFGIVLLPATALALFMRLVSAALDDPASDGDLFASVLRGNGLPLIYFSLVAIPPLVFSKYIFGGVRSINRAAMADEEQLATLMRQDGWQR